MPCSREMPASCTGFRRAQVEWIALPACGARQILGPLAIVCDAIALTED